jgi:cytochrome c biogenesis protein CcmG, thiol:disulfide interchange protein DsbE
MNMKKIALCSILFLALTAIGQPAGRKAPGFALNDNSGGMVFLSSLKQNLVISFWASYCKPCKTEMPRIIELEKKYQKSRNLKLVLINIDTNDDKGEAAEKAKSFLKSIGVEHDYLLDFYQTAVVKYNPEKRVPATFLVNRQGLIVFEEIGYKPGTIDALDMAITRLN